MRPEDRTDPASRNVDDVARLERESAERISPGERIAQTVTDAIGTPAAAFIHLASLGAWIAWNTGVVAGLRPFDPYPFGLLTMLVSFEAAIVSIFVLITQNRMIRASERRDRLALQVDMLAEQEMTLVLRTLSRIADKLGVEPDARTEEQARKLLEETNVHELMEKVDQRFGKP